MANVYRTRIALSGTDWALPAGSVSTGTFEACNMTWVVFPGAPAPIFEQGMVEADPTTFEAVEEVTA